MTRTLLRITAPFGVAVALLAGSAAAESSPLNAWMKANMQTAINGEDFAALKTNFDLLATKQPAGYSDWTKFAKAGSTAAAKKDAAGANSACASCHKAYKVQYKKDFPTKPFP